MLGLKTQVRWLRCLLTYQSRLAANPPVTGSFWAGPFTRRHWFLYNPAFLWSLGSWSLRLFLSRCRLRLDSSGCSWLCFPPYLQWTSPPITTSVIFLFFFFWIKWDCLNCQGEILNVIERRFLFVFKCRKIGDTVLMIFNLGCVRLADMLGDVIVWIGEFIVSSLNFIIQCLHIHISIWFK